MDSLLALSPACALLRRIIDGDSLRRIAADVGLSHECVRRRANRAILDLARRIDPTRRPNPDALQRLMTAFRCERGERMRHRGHCLNFGDVAG
jgi:hypothetical protein